MENKTKKLIEQLAKKVVHLNPPIHLLAICSGGITLAKGIQLYLEKKKIPTNYYEIWADVIDGKRKVGKMNFTKRDYKGTAVIVEDVIWRGAILPPVKKY